MALKQKIENGSVYQLNPFAGTWKKIGKAPERYSNKKFEGKVFEGKDLPIDVAPERKVVGKVYLPEMSTKDFRGLSLEGQIARAGKPLSQEQNAAAVASGRAKIEAEFPTFTKPSIAQSNTPSQPVSSPKYDYTEFKKRKAFAQSGKGRVVNEDNIDSLIM